MNVECVGGPRDGEFITVSNPPPPWIEVQLPEPFLADVMPNATATWIPRRGRYVLRVSTSAIWVYSWCGEV